MGVKTRNLGNSEGKDIQWQAPLNADGSTIFDLDAGKGYFLNTTGGKLKLKMLDLNWCFQTQIKVG